MNRDAPGVDAPHGYAVVRPIGRGSAGVVWEARQLSTERAVALKLVDAGVGDPDAVRQECRALAALAAHPHVVTIFDADVRHGRPWLAMELCRRGSLAAHLAAHGPLDPLAALHVLAAVADALAAAHGRRILHCDVKPANLLVTDHGTVVVSDFGLARDADGRGGTAGYTPHHVAPEVAAGQPPSAAADVHALGTTTAALLTGRPGALAPPAVPAPFADLLAAMVAPRPAQRPDAAAIAEYARDLLWEWEPGAVGAPLLPPLAAGEEVPAPDPRPSGPATVLTRRPRRVVEAATEPALATRRRVRPGQVVGTALLVAAVAGGALAVRPYATAAPDGPAPPSAAAPPTVPPPDVRGLVTLRVVDGTPTAGIAARAAADFRRAGWLVEAVGGVRVDGVATSTAFFRPGTVEEDAARRLAAEFGLRARPRPATLQGFPPGIVVVLTG